MFFGLVKWHKIKTQVPDKSKNKSMKNRHIIGNLYPFSFSGT